MNQGCTIATNGCHPETAGAHELAKDVEGPPTYVRWFSKRRQHSGGSFDRPPALRVLRRLRMTGLITARIKAARSQPTAVILILPERTKWRRTSKDPLCTGDGFRIVANTQGVLRPSSGTSCPSAAQDDRLMIAPTQH